MTLLRPEPIAIVGSGCRFPGGSSSPSKLWKLLENPRDVGSEIPPERFNATGFFHPDGTHHGTSNVRHSYLMEEDIKVFDAPFFNISPNEADSIDPQQRLLLETVYEALEAGGHTLDALRGSDTAVYVGTMGVDYNDALLRDLNTIPTYFATGTNRAIISNRVSYFFDWHGPSMTIDTACSSSLIAVHQGVRALRSGESRVAVACGTQVILGPEAFIFESKMKMLSPTGRSRMWDSEADGYARGEGVAAVVLKRLSDAIADGDHIECLIRETGANQDGFSNGITVPNTEAQAMLIRQTYQRAGLDPEKNPYDRPQFFEAHGTGTKAGDPKEAAAIHRCFGNFAADGMAPLYASGIIQKGIIPPNLLFNSLNPAIEPFYKGLEVPTSIKPWPQLPEGVPRRVSVNSFGFGGSNAHAIVEEYRPAVEGAAVPPRPSFTPFVFSAVSEASLVAQLQAYSEHLGENSDINPVDLAWTLQSRRSQLPFKVSFSAATIEELKAKIDEKLAQTGGGTTVGTRSNIKGTPHILGVFTGQGAQWPAMGAELIRSSEFVRKRVQELDQFLTTLPEGDRPEWNLEQEMMAGNDTSRIAEAALSQPLCTAIQIILVDLLLAARIKFSAVVGHSSGEIGAAYAAGFLSDKDALRVAYYRGLYAKLAGNVIDVTTGQKSQGAMMAVGTSWEDAHDLLSLRAFRGRLAIAAHNSSASVTLSGDVDAIVHAKKVFDEEKKFARVLKVDTAYHSHHMLPCGDPYDKPVEASEVLRGEYWRDNMQNAVRFADAVKNAMTSDPQIVCAVEVGPHPALKGPATQNIGEGVDFQSYKKLVSGAASVSKPKLVVGLPSYKWNHGRTHWQESRRSRKMRGRQDRFHELLGVRCPDSTDRELRWQNVLKVSEIPWMEGHQLQGQTVFPAAGYCAMAIEAAKCLAGDEEVEILELHDLSIPRAIAFEDDNNAGVETLVTLTSISRSAGVGGKETTANFALYSCPVSGGATSEADMELTASGSVKIVFGKPNTDALFSTPLPDYNMADVDTDRFYASLSKLGYGYYGPFRGMTSLKRRLNQSSVLVDTYAYGEETVDHATVYLVHPTWLDVAFQASMLAFSAPGDERLWSLHVPTSIRSIRINPEVCGTLPLSQTKIPVCSSLADGDAFFSASIDLFSEDGSSTMVQVEDLEIKPFAPATAADDRRLFSYTKLDVASPDGASIVQGDCPTSADRDLAVLCERVSLHYLRKWKAEITDEDWAKGQAHHDALRNYMNHMLGLVSQGRHPTMKKQWLNDTAEDIKAMTTSSSEYLDSVDLRLLCAVGENIPAAVRGDTTILEHMLPDNMLDDFYREGLGFAMYNTFLSRMMKQIVHRYPHAKILEIGAGTGGATRAVLNSIGHKMSSYTYTDISVGFFEKATEIFKEYSDKMTFKTLDVEKGPASQGYEPHSYDIIIASNVLHATSSMQKTLENTRQLLKPGGYLMLLELTNNDTVRFSNIMGGLTGWWLGVDDGRKYAPTMTPGQWHNVLRKAGFGGVDAITPEIDTLAWPFSIIASQAVDDRVNFLRKPLARTSTSTSIYLDSVVILGGTSLEGARIAEEVVEYLGRFCGEITVLAGLPTEEEAERLTPMSTFINLVDIDGTPIFKDVTAEKMEGLKRVYELARHLLWITHNAQLEEPYHNASIGFSRAMHHEAGHINMNHLDVSDLSHHGAPKAIVEHLLRQCALDEWDSHRGGYGKQYQSGKTLWSLERDVYVELERGGQFKIPRVIDNVSQNARLNSTRRVIKKVIPIESSSSTTVSLTASADDFSSLALVEQALPTTLRRRRDQDQAGEDRVVKLEASSVRALRVAPDTFLFIGVGKDKENNTVATLSDTNSPETVPIVSVPLDTAQSADNLLVAVVGELAATALIQAVSAGSSILVHASSHRDRVLASALSRQAADKSVRVTFTYNTEATTTAPDSWIGLNSRAPRHVIRKTVLRTTPTHFLDLTTANELSTSIASILPTTCKRVDSSEIYRHQPSSLSLALSLTASLDALVARLQDAVSTVTAKDGAVAGAEDLVIQLDQIHDPSLAIHITSVVHWAQDGDVQVEVEVRSLEPQRLFSKDKTYLLVGLTGQIGQSLCEWMVANGAGCVCLTSRNPKIDPKWVSAVEATSPGSTVKVFSLDVTDKSAVEKLVSEVRATCPPIAGVANGAMVLHDCLFSKMDVEVLQKVLGPKIDGSRNLDEVFYDEDLDFFILFSSSAYIIGNSGQSNYAAANGYLNTLARQRRRRGLAASAFDIGRVAGIGYVETAGQAVMDQLTRFGLMAISETEFRQIFAETIRAGYPVPEDTEPGHIPVANVTTGIRNIRDDEEIGGPWFDNPLFSHCIIEANGAKSDNTQANKRNALPVTEQLACAANKEQALEVLQECFSNKLKVMLQLSDQEINPETSLVELGVDSLVAVEVRSWFLKELQVDVPVLKVVGGASLTELCQHALNKLPEELLATIGTGDPSKAAPAVKAVPEIELNAPATVSTASSTTMTRSASQASSTPVLSSSTPATELSSRSASPDGSSKAATGTGTSSPLPPFLLPPPIGEAKSPPVKRKFLKTEQISFGQSRFWFLRLLLEDPTTSNVAFYYKVTGSLRIGDLERAVRMVTARHEALRTAFVEHETQADQAYQKVLGSSPVRLEVKKAKSVEEVVAEYHELQKHIFDLESGELIRLVLISLSPTIHYFLFNYHHIIMDGVSFQVLVQDLEKAYKGQPLGPAPRQFPDYSRAQREAYESGKMDDELKYWRSIFPTGQEPPVLPLLPMARTSSRAAMKNFGVHQVMQRIEPGLMARIKAVAKSQRSTPFHFYLAAYKTMLFRFTEANDLTIGIADANRSDGDLTGSIGFFLNLLTLRFRRQTDQRFSDAVAEARTTTYGALGNSRLPFDVLLKDLNVNRSSDHSPFFQAFFDYRQGAQEKFSWGGNTQFEFQEVHPGRTAYDITLDITDNALDSLAIFRVQKGLYDITAANLVLETYIHFLDVLSSNASLTLKSTPLFSDGQLSRATEIGRGPELVSDWAPTLPLRIDEVAQRNQGKSVAVKDGLGHSLTYLDLINRIEAIAEALQKAGVSPGNRVPVFQTASADWVCSMLAIMRVGGVYVPLDLRNPLPRLAVVVVDCEPAAILVDSTTRGDVKELNVPGTAIVIDVEGLASKASAPVPNISKPDSPAAILYTSGSTGAPKGIVVTHAGLRNEIEGYTKTWKLGAERTLQQSAFTFNHSSDQIYTGLTNGGMVYVVPWSKRGDPIEITRIVKEESITYTKATPAEYSLWLQYGNDNLRQATRWRAAFGGGEPMPVAVTKEFAKLGLPQLRLYNSYGPTEISISSTKMELDYRNTAAMEEENGRIPCGFSLPNYYAYILDEQLRPLPAGMPGELCIGGAGVSLGYLKNGELTNKHFVPDPFATNVKQAVANGWTRMYRTGDFCHLRDDGALVFHSRMAGDTQVKIRGLRIELSDIESNIVATSDGALKEAVVTLRKGDPDFLVAHVVFAPGYENTDNTEAFLAGLLSRLPIPQYMVPVVAIPLDRLPLTNHSKTDRKALKELPLPQLSGSRNPQEQDDGSSEDLTETMLRLKTVWQDVLNNKELGFDIRPSTSFFLVGGNSLLAIRLQSRIRDAFNVTVRLVDLLQANKLGEMARKIEESASVSVINWDHETKPPTLPSFLQQGSIATAPPSNGKKTILVTGATGFLAKYILPQLIANPAIGTIHAVAVRNPSKLELISSNSSKIITHLGDISAPLLGLSEAVFRDLANSVDVIIHFGAARSFWDNYHVLRHTNVQGTSEIVKLAAPRRAHIHYISTMGVLPRDDVGVTNPPASAAANVPPADGSDGYVATRWASERILERSAEALGVPSTIYRFLPSMKSATATSPAVLDEFVRFVDVTAVFPEMSGWTGRIDMMPASQASNWLLDSVFDTVANKDDNNGSLVRFAHIESTTVVNVVELHDAIEQHRSRNGGSETMPGLRWIGHIKQLGFDYLLTSQDATVQGVAGAGGLSAKFESRR
ncbi:putative lovastatin nonaketide synthase protein [Scedosporium apiospermum]|uniref:Putative lovastatin nonaketide synthase protein n=1 Tax=Pseudallescheria apiosperma TaxID=563466 RepID=A0A084G0F7_PSEDA|nr:putative lovastatin nonaketide synthase protein [Scedosporium apiospermum]KEZ40819.1 putative lovastatin nonaketide synthase protein [Scedosporium apiospermum]